MRCPFKHIRHAIKPENMAMMRRNTNQLIKITPKTQVIELVTVMLKHIRNVYISNSLHSYIYELISYINEFISTSCVCVWMKWRKRACSINHRYIKKNKFNSTDKNYSVWYAMHWTGLMADLTLDKKKNQWNWRHSHRNIPNKTKINKNKWCTTVLWDKFEQLTVKVVGVPGREREMGELKQG